MTLPDAICLLIHCQVSPAFIEANMWEHNGHFSRVLHRADSSTLIQNFM